MKAISTIWLVVVFLLAPGASGRFPATSAQISTPQIFAPEIVSTGKEFGITFMPGGKEAHFTRFDATKKTNHIYRTIFAKGSWQSPTPIGFSAEEWRDLDPAVTPDGKHLFFVSTRPKPGNDPNSTGKDMDIWVADREGETWGAPHWVENVNSDAKEGSPSIARDGTLYFFSDRGAAPGINSIYMAKLINGKYSSPERLSSGINSGASDTSPFISRDGKTLLFYSTRAGGYGKGDLYVSFRRKGNWTQARNLGPIVNTQDSEYNPSVSPDGEQLYFGRNRNIYVVSVRAIGLNSLQPKLFR